MPELLFVRGGLFTNGKVFRVNLATFEEQRVSNEADTDIDAEWSPDGTRIVLVRNGSSTVTVDAAGGNVHTVDTQSGRFLLAPQWSPDGTRIAYMSIPTAGGASRIYSADVNGTVGVNLTPGFDAANPRWSPDGTRILFTSDAPGNRDVFVMASSGAGPMNLTNRALNDDAPRWSPDGSKIVLIQGSRVWTMDANGANLVALTGTIFADAAWSHDGEQIFIVRDPDGAAQLQVMNANGTNQHPIETDPAADREPVPSPDGTRIAWVSKRDGNFEIYVASPDGTNPTRVTNNVAPDTHPRWRPCLP
ncbi:MAG: PD40 domain-containing protein [Deltaproteobacteria bacterium]|nr:PD40 domain-containing protein [Deltaproteobacteria bacterium]